MAELLLRSIEQTRQRAREYRYLTILRQLLPDEARILSALADGSTYPLLHVGCRTDVTGARRLLSNASTVGRAAGVAVPAQVPRYLSRLLHLDLVEIGEPDPALPVQYDICLTDELARVAEEAARAQVGRGSCARPCGSPRSAASCGTPATPAPTRRRTAPSPQHERRTGNGARAHRRRAVGGCDRARADDQRPHAVVTATGRTAHHGSRRPTGQR